MTKLRLSKANSNSDSYMVSSKQDMSVVANLKIQVVSLFVVATVTVALVNSFAHRLIPTYTRELRMEGGLERQGNGGLWRGLLSGNLTVPPVVVANASSIQHASGGTTMMNPGCETKKLHMYKPVDVGITYNHPAIVQYAKLSATVRPVSLTYMDYMSMMSAYKFLKPEKMIIHTYTSLTGKYWELMQKWNVEMVVNKVQRVSRLGGRPVGYISHQADYIKLRGLLEYGGLASDFDVLVVNGTKLKEMQRISECVLSREGQYINAGFTSCIKNSSFVRGWINFYHTDYRPHLWLHNASFKPTDILQDKKSNVCYNVYLVDGIATKPTFSKAGRDWKAKNGVAWREKVAAHYFDKSIRSFTESALNRKDSIGELLRHVMNDES